MKRIRLLSFFSVNILLFSLTTLADNTVWVLVDTSRLTLEIKQGNKTISLMENISIGRNGSGFKHRRGDDITPLGHYKISWINNNSPFYRFYGFNYPTIDNANEALLSGLLSKKAHTAISKAHKNNIIPPQNTSIGGRIGIHGLGEADETIHQMINWTHGCIALKNEQIDELDKWIREGTRIEVK